MLTTTTTTSPYLAALELLLYRVEVVEGIGPDELEIESLAGAGGRGWTGGLGGQGVKGARAQGGVGG